jgi:hypothetical protein
LLASSVRVAAPLTCRANATSFQVIRRSNKKSADRTFFLHNDVGHPLTTSPVHCCTSNAPVTFWRHPDTSDSSRSNCHPYCSRLKRRRYGFNAMKSN